MMKPFHRSLMAGASTLVLVLALEASPAYADDFIVDTATVFQNGDAGNVLDGDDSLTITNTGSITTQGVGVDAVYATGTGNTISNDGTITTAGSSADGIRAANNNIITNSGSISTDGNRAYGIFARDNNTITNSNSGLISTDGYRAYGISLFANNIVVNSGTIITTDMRADGINATSGNTITNSGMISTDGFGSAGIQVTANNIVVNSGTIITEDTYSDGINVSNNSIITNSGTLSTAGNNSDGIFARNNNIITNSGLISATGDTATASAIDFFGYSNTLTLNPGSVLIGSLNFRQADNTLNVGNGLSIAKTFIANLPGTINSNGAPVAVNGLQVAVVDPTGIAMQDEVITDLTNNISNSVFNALKSARSGAGSGPSGGEQPLFLSGSGSASGSPESATRYWGKVFGSRRQQEGTGPTVDSEHWVVGTVSGVDAPISANIRAGGFLGGSTGEVEVAFDSQETEIDSFFGGLYAGTQMGSVTLDFMVTGGWTEHERERKVANNLVATGIQTAKADFDGRFIAPEIAVSVDTGLLVPSAKVRYTAFHLDGFTETGALGNFSVDDRDLHILQGRFQIAMPIISSGEDSSYTKFEPYVGIEGRSIVSGESVDAILLGQSISFNPGGDDDVFSVYAGFNGSARVASNVELFVNAEANFEDDDTYRFGGNVGAKVTF